MFKRTLKILRKLGSSYLKKLILAYSIIIVFMLAGISLIATQAFSDVLKQKEISFEKQITKRVQEYFDDTVTTSRDIVKSIYVSGSDIKSSVFNILNNENNISTYEYNVDKNRFDTLFSSQLQKDNNIIDIIIYVKKTGEVMSYSRNYRKIKTRLSYYKEPWFMETLNGGNLQLIPTYMTDYMDSDNKLVYSAVTSIFDSSGETLAVMIINLDAIALKKSYAAYAGDIRGTILVLDKTGEVFFDSSDRYYGSKYPYFSKIKNSKDYLMLDQESIVSISPTERDDLNVVGIVPKTEIDKSIRNLVKNIYLILAACIIASLVPVYLTSKYFSKRITTITKAMKEVELGRFDVRIAAFKGNDEIQQISGSFNNMCIKLDEYINRVYVSEIRTKQAELGALQMQINPHFLYNTLEAIRMQALIDDSQATSEMIFSLANLFRATVKNRNSLVTISNELDYCRAYVDILKSRYMDRLRLSIEVEESIMDCCIPKFIFQPVVENSIKYGGLDSGLKLLTISISGCRLGNDIEVTVTDNGRGMTAYDLDTIRSNMAAGNNSENQGSLGLININERIKLVFGTAYGIKINSGQETGTGITIHIPSKSIEEMGRDVQSSFG